jgi:uncharacterized protein (DUF779 family)
MRTSGNIGATAAAIEAVERLKERHGPLMFVQSGGCCDGSSPMCLRAGELLVSPGDVLLGEIAGCPFYIDADQYERWRRPRLVIDVLPGHGESFSLEGADDIHFVADTLGVEPCGATAPVSRPAPALSWTVGPRPPALTAPSPRSTPVAARPGSPSDPDREPTSRL